MDGIPLVSGRILGIHACRPCISATPVPFAFWRHSRKPSHGCPKILQVKEARDPCGFFGPHEFPPTGCAWKIFRGGAQTAGLGPGVHLPGFHFGIPCFLGSRKNPRAEALHNAPCRASAALSCRASLNMALQKLSKANGTCKQIHGGCLGPPARCQLLPFPFWLGGLATKIDCRRNGTLILTSLLEDLGAPPTLVTAGTAYLWRVAHRSGKTILSLGLELLQTNAGPLRCAATNSQPEPFDVRGSWFGPCSL